MVVSDFTVPELERLREKCNFVGHEEKVFELRSRGIPLERIAEEMNMSYEGIKKVSRKVNNKINRVL